MAKRTGLSFTVRVDPSVKIATRAKGSVAAAIGGAAAAEIARLDMRGTVAFIPRIDWPGGMIINLDRYLNRAQLGQIMGGM
jgi:hypothetical protein